MFTIEPCWNLYTMALQNDKTVQIITLWDSQAAVITLSSDFTTPK